VSERPISPGAGPHQMLLVVYAIFALAAGARSAVQLATRGDEAPFAYTLSLVAALTYTLAWFAIRRAAQGRPRLAWIVLWSELAGVATVGTLSIIRSDLFPDATVWSTYGVGYLFVPAILPVAGLLWLRSLPRK
jgi:RsiW-degrading membrane proteinase PrsW (M82 family)